MTRRKTSAPRLSVGRVTGRLAAAPATPAQFVPPYPPSWFDHLADRIDRLPGPAWLAYLLLGVAGFLLQTGLQSLAGVYQPGRFVFLHVWIGVQFAYMLGLMHYLDRSAQAALVAFRPVLDLPRRARSAAGLDSSSFEDLRYRLTTLPRRTTRWAALAGVILGLALPMLFIRPSGAAGASLIGLSSSFGISPSPIGVAALLIQFAFAQAVAGTLVYHCIHQLSEINRVYLRFARLNLYRLQPLYAFSIPAALTAGGLIIYNYAWFAAAPQLLDQPVSLVLSAFFAIVAAATFAWPLLGIHGRLVAEKKRCLAENAHRFEAAVGELHQRVDKKALSRMDDLNKTLSSLEIEQAALHRIPTWPWDPGTLRSVVAALALPIVIWLIQYVLQKVLG